MVKLVKICYTYFGDVMQEYKDGLIGLAVGDAMGIALVDISREELLIQPVTDMIDGGKHGIQKGTWSTPTELTMGMHNALKRAKHIDTITIMHRLVEVDNGVYSISKGTTTLGKTTKKAIEKFKLGIDPEKCGSINFNENGSGALTMMYPVAYFAYKNKLKEEEIYEVVKSITSLTHKHEINIIGCYIYTLYLLFLLRGKDKYAALSMLQCCDFSSFNEEYLSLYDRILKKSLKDVSIDNIKTDGYIVSTIEAAFYVLLNSENYAQSILGAINLGGKTNTVSSIVGCMAGILYKLENIPVNWLKNLKGTDILEKNV